MKASMVPDIDTLEAFGVHGDPIAIPGGRGLCYTTGEVVLRPSEDDIESQWVAELTKKLPPSSLYRVAQPRHVIGNPQSFVYKGWATSSLIHVLTKINPDFKQILATCRSFHKDVKASELARPDFLSQRSNRWREADLVTWDEKKLDDVDNVNTELLAVCQPVLKRLRDMMEPLPSMNSQMLHEDLTGNVLFHDEGPSGIIDMTPY